MTRARAMIAVLSAIVVSSMALARMSWGAPEGEGRTDDVVALHAEISADIGRLRRAVEAELAGMELTTADAEARLHELARMGETVSEDMAAWGLTEAQRERHEQALAELGLSWSAYASLLQGQASREEGASPTGATFGAEEIVPAASNDIGASDVLRREIEKASDGLGLQVFYLQSRLGKLRLDLADVGRLNEELLEADGGGTPLDAPRGHALELEAARLGVVLSWAQVNATWAAFDENVARIRRMQRREEDMKAAGLTFPQELLSADLDQIQARIDALGQGMEEARKELGVAGAALVRAGTELGSADVLPISEASSRYLARQAEASYWEHRTILAEEEIRISREARRIWRARYDLFHGRVSGEEIWALRDEAQSMERELRRQLDGVRTMEGELLRRIETTQDQMEGTSGKIRQEMERAVEAQRRTVHDVLERYEAMIPEQLFLVRRLRAEASDKIGALAVAEKIGSFSRATVMGFLDTELWRGDDYSVTVGKLIVALLVFVSSFFLSSLGSRWLRRRMVRRFNASATAANATQRTVFYILWLSFVLIALQIVNIPLTAFAFLGGAMAVAIGFGAQVLFNDLISGFIIIFSRPFKVGDIIDVSGIVGVVEDIGSRSTRIKTWDHFDVILPNRTLLEGRVTNWTGADTKKREVVSVMAAYASDTRKVEELLLRAMKDHSKVLKDPAPFVLLKELGDSGLEFEAYFWVDLKQAVGPKVASDMRHHIVALFRSEGIEIPYPQRDVRIVSPSSEPS
ncbi:MAG: mechanosensitive ion channel [Synergistaceae bacterium]|nr:mechanosensitive ion channel [Synergistaceae bacterium]